MVQLFTYILKYCITAIFLLSINSCSYFHKHFLISDIKNNISSYNTSNIDTEPLLFPENIPIRHEYQSLFEDNHLHHIGDTVTIILQENISASNSSSSSLSRNSVANIGIVLTPGQLNPLFGMNIEDIKTGLDSVGKNEFSGKGSNTANNTFSGLITVAVINILPNGNLKIAGEKQVTVNEGVELIRISGVINPRYINKNNFIVSTKIADAHIEYINSEKIRKIQKMGWLQRLLLKISPL